MSSCPKTMYSSASNSIKAYRPDVDGLRALAVLAVVAYHAFPGIVRGGFVGVDIFFVISGFLISGIILDSLNQEKFSFLTFYARRIRRIFPALLLVLASVLAFGWFTLLADEYEALGKHVFGGAAFISNILFWGEAGYWDSSAISKPLLHLWSLGIEEQFYIIFPCLLFLAWKKKLRILTFILALLAISFICNIYYFKRDPVLDFYAPYTRFWELLAGVVVAVLARWKSQPLENVKQKISSICHKICNRGSKEADNGKSFAGLLAWLGFILLLLAITTTKSEHHFPGYRALYPTLGTMFILAAGQNPWVNRVLFSNKLAVGIGLISYPLYLWHWPLLSFAHILHGAQSGAWSWLFIRSGCVLIAVVLAFLTYKLVERPIRFKTKTKNAWVFPLVVLMIIVAGAGLYVKLNEGLPKRTGLAAVAQYYNQLVFPPFRDAAGLQYALDRVPAVPKSAYLLSTRGVTVSDEYEHKHSISFMRASVVPGAKTSVALLGDSHAWSAYPGVAKRNAKLGINTVLMAEGASRSPITGLGSSRNDNIQKILTNKANEWVNYLSSAKDIKQVYIFSYWGYVTKHSENFKAAVQNTIDRLNKAGKSVFVVADYPILPFDIRTKMPRPFQLSNDLSTSFKFYTRQKKYQKEYFAILDSLENATIIKNTTDSFCPNGDCVFLSGENFPLYVDYGHLSLIGSDYLVNRVLEPYLELMPKTADSPLND